MAQEEQSDSYPRDPKTLAQELSLALELRNIKRHQALHERLSDQWWERFLLLALFVSTIGFLLTAITLKLAPRASSQLLMQYILYVLFFFMMVSLVAVLEYLLSKLQNLRKLVFILEQDQDKILRIIKEHAERSGDDAAASRPEAHPDSAE
ncbi:hypothetical protein JXA32_16980 [Candidatus Sumerlaeota bacterium]|nr:hypothetical protein [Candidatus Sumerlaeota bacterium]